MTLKVGVLLVIKLIFAIPIVVLTGAVLFETFKLECPSSLQDSTFLLCYFIPTLLVAYIIIRCNKKISLWPVLTMGVISLIILLVAVSSLNSSRKNPPNATVMFLVSNLRAGAEMYYYDNGFSYAGLCSNSSSVVAGFNQIEAERIHYSDKCRGWFWQWFDPVVKGSDGFVSVICNAAEAVYVINAELPYRYHPDYEPEYFCVDSAGFVGVVQSNSIENYQCPTSGL